MGSKKKKKQSKRSNILPNIVIAVSLLGIAFLLHVKQVTISKNYVQLASKFDEMQENMQMTTQIGTKGGSILVLYTGPSNKKSSKAELYQRNFDFFMNHGVDCERQDTLLVVGHDYYDEYKDRAEALDSQCRKHGHSVILLTRRDKCYDMESLHLLFNGGVPGVNVDKYDYFFYINCGVTGPGVPAGSQKPWTSYFTELLDDKVKMTGLSLNCEKQENHPNAHIQSMMYALDRKGVQLVKESGAIYDCLEEGENEIVHRYERRMGTYILNQGYALRSYAQRNYTLTAEKRKDCTVLDIWITPHLIEKYGHIPTLEKFIFFKTSRILTEEMAKKINHSWPKRWGDWR